MLGPTSPAGKPGAHKFVLFPLHFSKPPEFVHVPRTAWRPVFTPTVGFQFPPTQTRENPANHPFKVHMTVHRTVCLRCGSRIGVASLNKMMFQKSSVYTPTALNISRFCFCFFAEPSNYLKVFIRRLSSFLKRMVGLYSGCSFQFVGCLCHK